ncbi:MAG: Asp/Glu racemase [Hyphomicrobiales bacterium]|nr:Asp/Glu racemase [Hyphomicrobiales bacterium]MCP5001836.1 Asp/Glu racemase [Hyphomicrobiales bacterium]
MTNFEYTTSEPIGSRATFGLVVLQTDETIEHDFRRLLPIDNVALYASRVPSGLDVSCETLGEMEKTIPAAVGLFPPWLKFECIGYGCTSASSVIGPARIAELVHGEAETQAVTEPVSALVAACGHLGLSRLGFLSPYVEEVSGTLRSVLAERGVETPVFGSFNEAVEEKVARLSGQSIMDAALEIGASDAVDAVFLSCTNLRTLDVIAQLEARLNKPVLSSNLALAWHMMYLAGELAPATPVGRLMGA